MDANLISTRHRSKKPLKFRGFFIAFNCIKNHCKALCLFVFHCVTSIKKTLQNLLLKINLFINKLKNDSSNFRKHSKRRWKRTFVKKLASCYNCYYCGNINCIKST